MSDRKTASSISMSSAIPNAIFPVTEIGNFISASIKPAPTAKRFTLPKREHSVSHNSSYSIGRSDQAYALLEERVISMASMTGLKGVEDMNQITKNWMHYCRPENLLNDLKSMLKNAMLVLTAKLAPTSEEQLPAKTAENWSFFFGDLLPNIQAVLLPIKNAIPDEDVNLRYLILNSFKNYVIWPMRGRLQGKKGANL